MKKKHIKHLIGELFILKKYKSFYDLNPSYDNYKELAPGATALLLDIVPISSVLKNLNKDSYCWYDIKANAENKMVKHVAVFLCGQTILHHELLYKDSLRSFYDDFKLAGKKRPAVPSSPAKKAVPTRGQKALLVWLNKSPIKKIIKKTKKLK